jgi:hypothetical protein
VVEDSVGGDWSGSSPVERLVESSQGLGLGGRMGPVVPQTPLDEVGSEAVDGVVAPGLFEFLGRDVSGGIVSCGVGTEAI